MVFLATVIVVLICNAHLLAQPIPPTSVTWQSDLSFGNFSPAATGGTVTVSTTGARTSSGVILLGGTVSNAQFTARSTGRSRLMTISFLTPSVSLSRTGGGGSMTLNLGPIAPASYTHPGGRHNQTIRIGGTLNVGTIHSNPPGNYTGTFTIIVNNM